MASKRVLVVEDDDDIRRNLRDLLESEGYQVDQAGNGQEAISLLRASGERPALVILDLTMPVMDGFQFRRLQENDPLLGTIPVVIMTADGHVEAKREKIGAKDFIRKPVDISDLLTKVERYCS